MIRVASVMGLVLLVGACGTPEEVAAMEASENAEETMGDERSFVEAEEGGDLEGGGGVFMPANAEEDVAMETEPYPE